MKTLAIVFQPFMKMIPTCAFILCVYQNSTSYHFNLSNLMLSSRLQINLCITGKWEREKHFMDECETKKREEIHPTLSVCTPFAYQSLCYNLQI